jgi:hypothetical protein
MTFNSSGPILYLLKGEFLDGKLRRRYSCVLQKQISVLNQGFCENRGRDIEQEVHPMEFIKSLLKYRENESLVCNVSVALEVLDTCRAEQDSICQRLRVAADKNNTPSVV